MAPCSGLTLRYIVKLFIGIKNVYLKLDAELTGALDINSNMYLSPYIYIGMYPW